MQKMRVYELAKDKNMSSKDMLVVLGRIGIEVKSHMSVLEPDELKKVREFFSPGAADKDLAAAQKGQADKKPPKENLAASGTPNVPLGKAHAPAGKEATRGRTGKIGESSGRKGSSPAGKVANKTAKPGPNSPSNKEYDKQQGRRKGKRDKKNASPDQRAAERGKKGTRASSPPAQPISHVKKITVGGTISVQELGKRMGKTANSVIKKLMELGIAATVNQEIDADTVVIVAGEFGIETEVRIEKPITEIEDIIDSEESLMARPPVVTVMGHVDHGKTSLLDAIREANVTASEAGGITQHIGAYQVTVNDKKITFLDTPGHEAFTAMRARGAEATDIAILVIAADDGVMPQTIEALNHSKAAGVSIIVAINKVDKPTANVDKIKQQLTEYGLLPEEWGGDTIFVPVSAKQGTGIDQLLEMVLIVAEVNELKANPNRQARGIVIEAELDKGRGPVATVLVQKGTLRIGDNLVIGNVFGKVRAMFDDKGKKIKEALPSTPAEVLGLATVPEPGDIFDVIEDEKLAKEIASQRGIVRKEQEFKEASQLRLEDIFKQMNTDGLKELNLVLKSDVHGSAEALRQSLERLNTNEVKVNVVHNGVGAISETDVMLAAASKAIIIGFNVRPDNNARRAAETEKIEIRLYRIIYEVIEDIKKAMSGLLEPDLKEVTLGQAEVRALFKVPKVGTIAGSYITEGKITSKAKVRVIRDGVVIHEGRLDSLKRFKDDAKEVMQGFECGIGIENFNDIKEGDIVEAFEIEEVRREL